MPAVLLIEPNADLRDILTASLSLEGFEVHAAARLREARALAATIVPEALIATVTLEGLEACAELIEALLARVPTLRVVLIENDPRLNERVVVERLSTPARLLLQPFTTDELFAALR